MELEAIMKLKTKKVSMDVKGFKLSIVVSET